MGLMFLKNNLGKKPLALRYFFSLPAPASAGKRGGNTEANTIEERRASTILLHFLCVEFPSAVSALKIPLKLYRSK